jgi:hypothetical protein
MKENKILVTINCPISEVFAFTINPKNTPKWIKNIQKEEVEEWPIKIGSLYKNIDITGKLSEYIVILLEEDKIFELASKVEGYHVRYTYVPITNNSSSLEYFEWVDGGELENPFTQDVLNNLKTVMESIKNKPN